jgi:tetratricopeptide (TPR) repeat protein
VSRRAAILAAAIVAVGIAGAIVWRHVAVRRAWERDRPALPAAAGARAPGLDARLQACAARLAAYPPDQAALEEFARVCHANGQLDEALAGYQVLARLQPRDGRWPYSCAVIHAGYGRLGEAAPLLRRATELAPDHVPGWLRLGAALLKADDVAGATAAYEEALRRAPEDPFALVGLARCALREERWVAARGLLQRAIAADPRMAPALHLLATVHERLGNPETAAAVLARADAAAMEVEPPDPWLDELYLFCHDVYRLRVVGASALAAGNLDRALAACERARQLAPYDARVAWQFGRIYLRVGRFDEARLHLERAVALDPDDDKAALDLIGLLRQTGDTAALARRQAAYESRFGGPPP